MITASLGQALIDVAPAVLTGIFEGFVVGWAQWLVRGKELRWGIP